MVVVATCRIFGRVIFGGVLVLGTGQNGDKGADAIADAPFVENANNVIAAQSRLDREYYLQNVSRARLMEPPLLVTAV